jgi:hypothetical protein
MSPVSRLTNAKMIRGGGGSLSLHGFDADKKNGPASEEPRPSMRMNASWFGSPRGSTDYKAVATISLRLGRLASDCLSQTISPLGAFLAWRIIARHALSPSIPRA